MAELEETFGAPVIEAYGMTEASHQMTANPLPPRQRKPGSDGVPTSVEVRILDAAGELDLTFALEQLNRRERHVFAKVSGSRNPPRSTVQEL